MKNAETLKTILKDKLREKSVNALKVVLENLFTDTTQEGCLTFVFALSVLAEKIGTEAADLFEETLYENA